MSRVFCIQFYAVKRCLINYTAVGGFGFRWMTKKKKCYPVTQVERFVSFLHSVLESSKLGKSIRGSNKLNQTNVIVLRNNIFDG